MTWLFASAGRVLLGRQAAIGGPVHPRASWQRNERILRIATPFPGRRPDQSSFYIPLEGITGNIVRHRTKVTVLCVTPPTSAHVSDSASITCAGHLNGIPHAGSVRARSHSIDCFRSYGSRVARSNAGGNQVRHLLATLAEADADFTGSAETGRRLAQPTRRSCYRSPH